MSVETTAPAPAPAAPSADPVEAATLAALRGEDAAPEAPAPEAPAPEAPPPAPDGAEAAPDGGRVPADYWNQIARYERQLREAKAAHKQAQEYAELQALAKSDKAAAARRLGLTFEDALAALAGQSPEDDGAGNGAKPQDALAREIAELRAEQQRLVEQARTERTQAALARQVAGVAGYVAQHAEQYELTHNMGTAGAKLVVETAVEIMRREKIDDPTEAESVSLYERALAAVESHFEAEAKSQVARWQQAKKLAALFGAGQPAPPAPPAPPAKQSTPRPVGARTKEAPPPADDDAALEQRVLAALHES